MAAVMSSRCFLSSSFLAWTESGDEPLEDWLDDEDPDGEMSLPWGSLETPFRQGYLQRTMIESIITYNDKQFYSMKSTQLSKYFFLQKFLKLVITTKSTH